MGDVGVVDLLVAVERLIEAHCDELDTLNVFPVPDADTGRNVLATVRAARVGAEQAAPDQRRSAAIVGALQGARGNAGALVSQLLRALVEEVADDTWPSRLARADELARAALAHPTEGTLLTAVRSAATAAAEHDDPAPQLAAAVAAAHAAVRDSPTQLEVLARAGVVDAGARAAALVLEAVAAVHGGTIPVPPAVEVPAGGPQVAGCDVDDAPFEVMYLLDPDGEDVTAAVRSGLDRIGGSVVVVEADRLISVHVHTDDIGGALDVGLAHGRPHHVRVEDLQAGQRDAAARGPHEVTVATTTGRVGLVVGTAGPGIARLAGEAGAITVPLAAPGPGPEQLGAAIRRTGAQRVVVLPGDVQLAALAQALGDDAEDVEVMVATAVDDPARVVAALAVLDPAAVDLPLLEEVASAVRSGGVRRVGDDEWHAAAGDRASTATTAPAAVMALLELLDAGQGTPELVSVLLGAGADVDLRDAVAAAVERHWPEAELELVDAELVDMVLVVGVE